MEQERELNVRPIELSCVSAVTPERMFRALTSQNELRKWWAPRVVMSKKTVSHDNERSAHMELLQVERNQLVRYSWRPHDWRNSVPETTITFLIRDLGVSRDDTGEGLCLELFHDGWVDDGERQHYEGIWKQAFQSLKELLTNQSPSPWWGEQSNYGNYSPVRIPELKNQVEELVMEYQPDNARKTTRKIVQFCSRLETLGAWYLSVTQRCLEFRFEGQPLFQIRPGLNFILFWQTMAALLGYNWGQFVDRFSVEQNREMDADATEIGFTFKQLQMDIWACWLEDLLHQGKQMAASPSI